jgi:hypothetical protein
VRRPAPEEIALAKADAQARFGRSELLLVELGAPILACVLLAPWDLDGYCAHTDSVAQDPETAYHNAAQARRCWPAPAELTALLDRWPAASGLLVERLMVRAGKLAGKPCITPLQELLDAAGEGAEVIPGLSRTEAQRILAAHPDQVLSAAVGPGPLSLVYAQPEGDVWLACRSAAAKAHASGKRLIQAELDFIRQAIVWSRQPVDALLDDRPALSVDMRSAYAELGGATAEATSKSL